MDNIREILNLQAELRKMPEYIRLKKIEHFQISIDIFNGNYEDLLALLEVHNNPENAMKLMGEREEERRRVFQIKIIRLLHNYIASAQSLIDHTRVHYNELYNNESVFSDYQDQIEQRFVLHPLSVFMKDLRQYFQHFRMPRISSNIHSSGKNPELLVSVRLGIDELNKFSGWKSKSKEYTSNFEKAIDLKILIEEYHSYIQDFHIWFSNRQTEIHKEDQKKVDVQKKKIEDIEF